MSGARSKTKRGGGSPVDRQKKSSLSLSDFSIPGQSSGMPGVRTRKGSGSNVNRPKSDNPYVPDFHASSEFSGMSGGRGKTRKGRGSPMDRPKSITAVEEFEDPSSSRPIVRKPKHVLNAQRKKSVIATREKNMIEYFNSRFGNPAPSEELVEQRLLDKTPEASRETIFSPSVNIFQTSGRGYGTPVNRPKSANLEEYEDRSEETAIGRLAGLEREKSPKNELVLSLERPENSNIEKNIRLDSATPSTSKKPIKRQLPKTPDASHKTEQVSILDRAENSNMESICLDSENPSASGNTYKKRVLPPTPVNKKQTARPSVNTTLKSSTAEHKTYTSEIPPFVHEQKKTLPEQNDEVRNPPFLVAKPQTEGTSTRITKVTDAHSGVDKAKTDVMGRIRNNLKFFRRLSSTEPETETKPGAKSLMEHLRIGERNFHKYCQNAADFAGDVKKVVVSKDRDYPDKRTAGPPVSVIPQSEEESTSSAATAESIIPTPRSRQERDKSLNFEMMNPDAICKIDSDTEHVEAPIFEKMNPEAIRKIHSDKEHVEAPVFKKMNPDAIRKIHSDKEDKEAEVSKLSEDLKNTVLSGDQNEVLAGAIGGSDLLQLPSGSSMLHSGDQVTVPGGTIRRNDVRELPFVRASPRKRNPLIRQKNVEEDEPPRESIDDTNRRR